MHLFLFSMNLKSEICELININFLTDVDHRRNSSYKLEEYILYAQGLGRLNCMVRIIFLECSTFQEQLWHIIIIIMGNVTQASGAITLLYCYSSVSDDQKVTSTHSCYSGWRKSEMTKYFEWIIMDISIVTLMIIENRALWLARSFASSRYDHLAVIITLKVAVFKRAASFAYLSESEIDQ